VASWFVPLLVAPFIGSFLGVLIRRLPAGRPVILGRSCCESCGRVLAARDLVPLVSYAVLRARCRACGARIAAEHAAIELAALAVAALSAATQPDAARVWAGCVLGWWLLAPAWIDWRWLRLPDALTLPLIPAGLAATLLLDPGAVTDHAAAAVAGYLAFRAIAAGYRRLRGREGLGQGDAKLLAAAGAWAGLAPLPDIVLIAALLGLAAAGLRALWRRETRVDRAVAFGPSLAVATWVVWLAVA
jgi:leader peptidase (prepilin peptidase)/N-methyltransferase